MKTGKWGKSGTSNFTHPRDKAEEELIIISANKQRKKTPEQEIKEVARLRAIYEGEGFQRKSEARKQAWEEYREQKTDDIQSPKIDLLETNKSTNITKTPTPEPEFNIEEAYEDAMERTAGKESQTQPLERQSTPKPALKKNARRPLCWFPKKLGF